MRMLLTLLTAVLLGGAAGAQAPVMMNRTEAKLGNHGYDVVAYFTQGEAVKGSPSFEHEWNGATWRFASAAHRDAFKRDPEAYAPQFGGFCAWAVSRNYTADVDPEAFAIVDGKLYLNYSKLVQLRWGMDRKGNIAKGHENWPKIAAKGSTK
jgi:YHS domain-containing protein